MNINNNFTPLAWHKGDIELQSNRATYAYGHIVPLIVHNQTLVPFQIIVESGALDSGWTFRLVSLEGSVLRTVTLDAVKVTAGDYDILIYNGGVIAPALPTGQYYLTLTSGQNVWYSDVVTVVSNVLGMTRIEWWDAVDLKFGAGRIVYRYASGDQTVQYKNRMYFFEEIGMPEYTTEEEGETRDGLFYATRVLSGKKYKMQVVQATEAMCDAMRFIHLSDNVEVRDGYGRTYSCDNVLVTPEWVNGGAVASVAIEITTDTFVKQVGGGYEGESPVIEGETGVIGQATIGEDFVIGG